jgi:hypothetical protein
MVEHGGHHPNAQSAQTEPSQLVEEWLQLRLVVLDDAIRPVVLAQHQDLAGELWQTVVIVAQVEPAIVPSAIRRNELRRDVELTSTRPHLKGAATGVHRLPHPPLARLLGEMFHLEKVEP